MSALRLTVEVKLKRYFSQFDVFAMAGARSGFEYDGNFYWCSKMPGYCIINQGK